VLFSIFATGMNVLLINPILYTPPAAGLPVHKLPTIKHTLFYNLALGFMQNGDNVTLLCSREYEPIQDRAYDFNIVFLKNKIKEVIKRFPNGFPVLCGLRSFLKDHHSEYDRIIVTESFSQACFWTSIICPEKTIVWQEVDSFVPGKELFCFLWYNIVVRLFCRKPLFVGMSDRAKKFVSRYHKNTSETVLEHGINVDVFIPSDNKQGYFIVVSQLINRKRIDLTIKKFAQYYHSVSTDYQLYIVGGGPMLEQLKQTAKECGVENAVLFLGQLGQDRVCEYLSGAMIMLTDTSHEYNMVSIIEAIASGTPVITNSVPNNSDMVESNMLGIKDDNWDSISIIEILNNYQTYYLNCVEYRSKLSYNYVARTLLNN